MMNKRIEEIMTSMQSFNENAYHKSELLPELINLQQEVVNLTFNKDHAEKGILRLQDVEKHFEVMNKNLGNVADKELEKFKEGSLSVCNMIKAEISGNKGEQKVFGRHETLKGRHIILKNVELRDDGARTELDAVVITHKAVFIIEVKNTAKDVFIDEIGNYYRNGDYQKLDSNIVDKVLTKEQLLRRALATIGYEDVEIKSLVVFTDNYIEVKNYFKQLTTCFLSQMTYIIDEYKSEEGFSSGEMEKMGRAIEASNCYEAYPVEMDMNQFKHDFATLMATLEAAAEDLKKEEAEQQKNPLQNRIKKVLNSRIVKEGAKTVITVAATYMITVAAGNMLNR